MSIETDGLEALALQRSAMLKIVQTIESILPLWPQQSERCIAALPPADRYVYR